METRPRIDRGLLASLDAIASDCSPGDHSAANHPRRSYRYRALGVLWHILNAMIVLLLILVVAVFLVRQFPQHPTLRPAAVALAVITAIQVMLGFTTFMMLILFPETTLRW